MAGKDDWVEDVRRWCFESSRPAVDGGDAACGMQPHDAADHPDVIGAARPWQPSCAEAIDLRDRNLLARCPGEAA